MMLVEEGKISVDDRLSKYLPDTPSTWKEITLRHLLTHTSGIPDLGGASPDSIIQEAAKRPLDFQPGEQWSYSNTGYTILGKVIERVTGKPLEVFLDEKIFRPLQMNWTARDFLDLNILSTGYAWEQDKLMKVNAWDRYGPGQFNRTWAFGHGGFVSTVIDLVKWDAALNTEKLLKRSTLEQMWTPAKLKDGSQAPAFGGGYGFGWMLYGTPGRRIITHGGNTTGVSSVIMRFLDDRVTVIVLTNRSDVDEFGLARGVAHFYLRPRPSLKDKDPTVSRKLKSMLQSLTVGKVDAALFAPEAETALLPELQQTGEFYRSLGPLRSFGLIDRHGEGKKETRSYRAAFRDTAWIQTFVLTEAGKIAELGAEPG
jgi:CubicO group peptidase (beta-lactamase class C family)